MPAGKLIQQKSCINILTNLCWNMVNEDMIKIEQSITFGEDMNNQHQVLLPQQSTSTMISVALYLWKERVGHDQHDKNPGLKRLWEEKIHVLDVNFLVIQLRLVKLFLFITFSSFSLLWYVKYKYSIQFTTKCLRELRKEVMWEVFKQSFLMKLKGTWIHWMGWLMQFQGYVSIVFVVVLLHYFRCLELLVLFN